MLFSVWPLCTIYWRAELQCSHYTHYSHCVESWCQNAYAILSMAFMYTKCLRYTQCSLCVELWCQRAFAILSIIFLYNWCGSSTNAYALLIWFYWCQHVYTILLLSMIFVYYVLRSWNASVYSMVLSTKLVPMLLQNSVQPLCTTGTN